MRLTFSKFIAVFTMLLAVLATAAFGADVAVKAGLSRGVTVIGDPVQFQIKIVGGRRLGQMPEVQAAGLQIAFQGQSTGSNIRIDAGTFSNERTVILVYEVVPEKDGKFTIPAISVNVDGKDYQTQPVGLTVQPKSAGGEDDSMSNFSFAEFVATKKKLYLGETLPVELRLYVDSRVRWDPVTMPEIPGDGFAKQKIPQPDRAQTERNGREYDTLTFKTAITPSRAGKLTLGPSEIPFLARVPRARPQQQQQRNPRSLFDMFNDDPFSDPYFSATQKLNAKAEALELTVLPLPVTGRPASFSGAVGSFQMTAEGNPKKVKVGDPVTMKVRVFGRGNFDRIATPGLKDSNGWRTYPASGTFRPDDELSLGGAKTFEIAVVPESRHLTMPVFEFSYFDPIAEKYVTLATEAAPLNVEGEAPPPPPVPATVADSSAPATPAPTAAKKPDDILGLRYDEGKRETFEPWYQRKEFLVANGAVGVLFLGYLALKLRRRPDEAARELAALRREKTVAWAELQKGQMGAVEFYQAATRVAQLETALATGHQAGGIDAATVRASARLDEEAAGTVDEIFNARAAVLYAGGQSAEEPVSTEVRDRTVAALRQLAKSYDRQ